MRVESVYTPGVPSAERRAELDEVERLVEAELPEIMARGDTGVRWGDALALRVAAHQLRKAREAKGLTLDAAATLTGLAADELGRLEAGQADPTLATLGRVAASYGYQVRISVEPAATAG
jgi:DNA-binding XRE family transcriptional regulator